MMIIMSVHHHHQRHDDYHVSWCSSLYTFQVSRYIEIKRDVRHPWQCKGCDDDSYQGTSSDAEDVVIDNGHHAPILIMVVVISGSIGDAEDAAMIVRITAVGDAKDPTMIVITLVIIFIII